MHVFIFDICTTVKVYIYSHPSFLFHIESKLPIGIFSPFFVIHKSREVGESSSRYLLEIFFSMPYKMCHSLLPMHDSYVATEEINV